MTKSLTYKPPDRIHTKQPSRAATRPKFDKLIQLPSSQQNDNKVINYKLSDNNKESSRGQSDALKKFKREEFVVRDTPVKDNVENDYQTFEAK